MTTIILLACPIVLTSIVAWRFRRRLVASTLPHLPRKENMKFAILLSSITLLAILALLPDLYILVSAMKLMSGFWRTALTLLATTFILAATCVGCSKPAEPARSHEIHWQGPETGFSATTPNPPDNTNKPKEP